MKSKIRNDLLLLAAVVLCAAILFCAFYFTRSEGARVEITLNGKTYGTYPLSKDVTVDVGGVCTVTIENGEAYVSSAACRGQICVHHKPISKSGESIVCLPGGVTVRVIGTGGVDFTV